MEADPALQEVFAQLKAILESLAAHLVVVKDEPTRYYLDTTRMMPNKKPLSFGAVVITKNYVSFHLIPVYVCPELLTEISPDLRARMQGKGCFNFKKVDAALFAELAQLTQAGFERLQRGGMFDAH